MEIAVIVGIILLIIFFGILIKDFWEKQQRNEIIIYRNIYDLFFNCIVYILPAVVFFIDKHEINQLLCYSLLCIGFTIVMCVSACDSNDTVGKKVTASLIKIITGIEVPLVIIIVLLLLVLMLGGQESKKTKRSNNYFKPYQRRNKW